MSNLSRTCRELIIAADLNDNRNFVQGIDIEDPLLSRVRKIARACLLMQETLETTIRFISDGDNGPPRFYVDTVDRMQESLTQIEEMFK